MGSSPAAVTSSYCTAAQCALHFRPCGPDWCRKLFTMSNPLTRKSCVVPKCSNTATNAPEKLFFLVPFEPKSRKKWMQTMKRANPPGAKSCVYCCEDHFDVSTYMLMQYLFRYFDERMYLFDKGCSFCRLCELVMSIRCTYGSFSSAPVFCSSVTN